jgi:hypothetical protein
MIPKGFQVIMSSGHNLILVKRGQSWWTSMRALADWKFCLLLGA